MEVEARAAEFARSNRLEDWTKTGSAVAAFSLGQGHTQEHPRVDYGNSNTAAVSPLPARALGAARLAGYGLQAVHYA